MHYINRLNLTVLLYYRGGRGGRRRGQPTDSLLSASSEEEKERDWDNTLICWSTVDGYVSYRDKVTGSWLISAMCKVCYHFYDALHTRIQVSITYET